jgi:hypothetical protein
MLNLILNEIGTRNHAKTVFHVKALRPGLVVDTRYTVWNKMIYI